MPRRQGKETKADIPLHKIRPFVKEKIHLQGKSIRQCEFLDAGLRSKKCCGLRVSAGLKRSGRLQTTLHFSCLKETLMNRRSWGSLFKNEGPESKVPTAGAAKAGRRRADPQRQRLRGVSGAMARREGGAADPRGELWRGEGCSEFPDIATPA